MSVRYLKMSTQMKFTGDISGLRRYLSQGNIRTYLLWTPEENCSKIIFCLSALRVINRSDKLLVLSLDRKSFLSPERSVLCWMIRYFSLSF